MKLIAEITDKEILGTDGLSSSKPRYTARAIVKNGDLYAVIHSEKFHKYSLPGGGVDDGEDIITALKREILEETGCTCGKISELGIVKENREQADYTQISYYYVVEADSVSVPHFTNEEISSGTELQWHTLSEMIKLINDIQPKTYQQQYLKARDVAALEEYVKVEYNG
ncbi:MAG: NUDIX domain-containing protein [Clostridia bacterium]|nr:NUDIX domain-containing protein [Clostridia bacterium]